MKTPTKDTELSDALTVNQVVERIPEALTVFSRHGIDTCCGGHLPVSEAAERHGVGADELLNQVREAAGGA